MSKKSLTFQDLIDRREDETIYAYEEWMGHELPFREEYDIYDHVCRPEQLRVASRYTKAGNKGMAIGPIAGTVVSYAALDRLGMPDGPAKYAIAAATAIVPSMVVGRIAGNAIAMLDERIGNTMNSAVNMIGETAYRIRYSKDKRLDMEIEKELTSFRRSVVKRHERLRVMERHRECVICPS